MDLVQQVNNMKKLIIKLVKVYPKKKIFIEHHITTSNNGSIVETFRIYAHHVTFIKGIDEGGYSPAFHTVKELNEFFNEFIKLNETKR
jgi:hypothetical protein